MVQPTSFALPSMPMLRSCITLALLAASVLPLQAFASTASCGTSNDPAAVVNAQVVAYNAHDVDAFAACYASSIRIQNLSGSNNPDIQGQDMLRKSYNFLTRMPRDFHVQVMQQMVSGTIVVNLERVIGRPDGKPPIDVIAIFDVRDGKIANVWFPPST
jgi:hypothetical protein